MAKDKKHSIGLMLPNVSEAHAERLGKASLGLVFLVATLVRMAFVVGYPTIHGGDAAARLAHADAFVLGYQLPLPQAFVVLGKTISDDPIVARLIFSAWGGVLASGLAALTWAYAGRGSATVVGLLASVDPLLIHYSIVPYQEPVAYGLAVWAFYLATRRRHILASVLMASACASRYEAWLLLPAFFVLTRSRVAILISAIPAVAWMLWWQGLGPAGLYVLDIDLHARRLSRVVFLGRKLSEYEPLAILMLALAGAIAIMIVGRRGRIWLAYVGIVMGVIVAFGHEYPPGSGLVSERLLHFPVLAALLLASLTLVRLSGIGRLGAGGAFVLMALFVVRDLSFERRLLRAAAVEPDLALAREIATAIEGVRRSNECVTVIAPAVRQELLNAYVAKVGAAFGDQEQARKNAASLASTSPDRDRIASHLRAPPGTVREAVGCPLQVVVDGVDPERGGTGRVTVVAAGTRRAILYRTH